jgi:hypothetical protein
MLPRSAGCCCSLCSVLHASDRISSVRGAPTSRQLPIQLELWPHLATCCHASRSWEGPEVQRTGTPTDSCSQQTNNHRGHRQIKTPHSCRNKILWAISAKSASHACHHVLLPKIGGGPRRIIQESRHSNHKFCLMAWLASYPPVFATLTSWINTTN